MIIIAGGSSHRQW